MKCLEKANGANDVQGSLSRPWCRHGSVSMEPATLHNLPCLVWVLREMEAIGLLKGCQVLEEFVQGVIMFDTNLVFWFTASLSQEEVSRTGLSVPFTGELGVLCSWEHICQSQSLAVMGIECNNDVRICSPQMIQHGLHAFSLHLVALFGFLAGGTDGAMNQQKGGVFSVLVFGAFEFSFLTDGGQGSFSRGALPGRPFGSSLREGVL